MPIRVAVRLCCVFVLCCDMVLFFSACHTYYMHAPVAVVAVVAAVAHHRARCLCYVRRLFTHISSKYVRYLVPVVDERRVERVVRIGVLQSSVEHRTASDRTREACSVAAVYS